MVKYNPGVIRIYARWLYFLANTLTASCSLIAASFGISAGHSWMIPTGADPRIGAVLGGVGFGGRGALVGIGLGYNLKLKAQLALCLIKIEENTRRLSTLPGA